ncbi:MAG: ATP-binding protein [Gemmataceae bacterium]|nr:ATP-binding protein [Gemmataceae bacterium]
MAKILIADDSLVDQRLAGKLLEKHASRLQTEPQEQLTLLYARDGKEALDCIAREMPDLVLTDLQMPEMNGLELVEAVKSRFPTVPVILMTAHGSEEIAIQALQAGAASYVPKRNLATDVGDTAADVLAVAGAKRHRQRLLDECWRQTETHFLLPNDLSHIAPLIGHLQDNLKRMNLCDENGLIRMAVALREALSNAILHGNLEVSSELRETNDRGYHDLIRQRQQEEPYDDRHVYIVARETDSEARYVIRDEGPGFDTGNLPDPTDPANLEKVSGRGLLLIRTFMDEVYHNPTGNEITMVKRRDRR